jgi:type IV fimbrial biogenesis protein FimT
MTMTSTIAHFRYRHKRDCSGAIASGFTLIELLIVIAIVAVLLAAGVPGMQNIIMKTRVKNASFDVYASILAARSDAITRNTTVTITPSGGNWNAGWTISDSGGNTKIQDAFSGITISGPATLVYTNIGHLPTGTLPADRKISLTAPGAAASDGRCINIDLSGRPVVTTGVCS